MTTKMRVWIAGVTLAAVAGLIYMSGTSQAGSGDDLKKEVYKIGELIGKGNNDGAAAAAASTAKKIDDLSDLMHMFRPRNKGGTGVGKTAGANPAKDGIEVMIRDLARDVPASSVKQAEALETTGYWIVAMAELSKAKGWAKDQGKKTKKEWNRWTEEMRTAGTEFSKAAAAKGAQGIKTAASKVNNACIGCHNIFKE